MYRLNRMALYNFMNIQVRFKYTGRYLGKMLSWYRRLTIVVRIDYSKRKTLLLKTQNSSTKFLTLLYHDNILIMIRNRFEISTNKLDFGLEVLDRISDSSS